jgi:hypothetical protein
MKRNSCRHFFARLVNRSERLSSEWIPPDDNLRFADPASWELCYRFFPTETSLSIKSSGTPLDSPD